MNSDSPQKHIWLKDISEDDKIDNFYVVRQKRLGNTKGGKPFISLVLADKTGEVEAKIWDRAEKVSPLFKEGDIMRILGQAGSYKGQVQITVSDIKSPGSEIDHSIFMESAAMEPSEMIKNLKSTLGNIKDIHLKMLIDCFLIDKQFMDCFKSAPAAKGFHHNYMGGLIEHTLSVCQMAASVADHYPHLNADLLMAGAFLHDIGKTKELSSGLNIDYTDEGRLLGHIVLGVSMVDDKIKNIKNFPEDLSIRLRHLILSHHGQYEFGSPKMPKFLEAIALNLIDDLDAKLIGIRDFAKKDRHEGAWTEYNKLFGRFFLKKDILPHEKISDYEKDTVHLDEKLNNKQQNLFSSAS